jgi:hypothetical protein
MGIACSCVLKDCAYYRPGTGAADACDCQHSDKKFYPKNPCPLYRKNWSNTDNSANEMKNRILKRKI